MTYTLKMCRHRLETRFADDEVEAIVRSIRESAFREVEAFVRDTPDTYSQNEIIADRIAGRFLSSTYASLCRADEYVRSVIGAQIEAIADRVEAEILSPPADAGDAPNA